MIDISPGIQLKVHPWFSMSLPIERTAGVFVSTNPRTFAPNDWMSTSMTFVASMMSLAITNSTACAFCLIAHRIF